ncbi:MAG: alpha/beta hydrolase-fold protein [Aeromicrobium erythreum]
MSRRTTAFVALGLLVVSVLAGCSRGSDTPDPTASTGKCSVLEPGTEQHTMTVDGQQRKFVTITPRTVAPNRKVPVVFMFHGLGSNAEQTLSYTAMGELASENNTAVVAPDAIGDPATWDVKGVANDRGKDAKFIDQLRSTISDDRCVDVDRQYVAGLSNGSAIVFALACRDDDPFAGYAGVAATFYEKQCDAAPPADLVYFHGTADKVVPFRGGKTPLFPVRAANTVMRDWAKHDGCDAEPRDREVGSDVERFTWSGCNDVRLDYYVIRGGGHTWPGAEVPIAPLGKTTSTIDATTLIADFFRLPRT